MQRAFSMDNTGQSSHRNILGRADFSPSLHFRESHSSSPAVASVIRVGSWLACLVPHWSCPRVCFAILCYLPTLFCLGGVLLDFDKCLLDFKFCQNEKYLVFSVDIVLKPNKLSIYIRQGEDTNTQVKHCKYEPGPFVNLTLIPCVSAREEVWGGGGRRRQSRLRTDPGPAESTRFLCVPEPDWLRVQVALLYAL